MTRCEITPAAFSSLLSAIIMDSSYIGEDPCSKSEIMSKFSMSYTSCDRYKRKTNECIASDIKDKWELEQKPYNLHWDSKIVPNLSNKYQHLEVLPVVLSFGKMFKLLGAPSFRPAVVKMPEMLSET